MPRTTCPTCGAVLDLTDDMVNQQVECGGCQAVFAAKPDRPPRDEGPRRLPSRRTPAPRPDDGARPSRRRGRGEDDEDDDRPRRRGDGSQGFATASLVIGILTVPFSLCCALFAVPMSLAGVVFGVLGMRGPSRGMAIAGTVLSVLGLALTVGFFILGLAFNLANVGNNGPPFGPNPPPAPNNRPFNKR